MTGDHAPVRRLHDVVNRQDALQVSALVQDRMCAWQPGPSTVRWPASPRMRRCRILSSPASRPDNRVHDFLDDHASYSRTADEDSQPWCQLVMHAASLSRCHVAYLCRKSVGQLGARPDAVRSRSGASFATDAFDRLTVGSAVSFVEEPGEKGSQASTVKLAHPRRARQASSGASVEPGGR